jgi:two-component system sensor histidine kinase KdpD
MRTAGEALAQDPPPADAAGLLAVLTGETERLERLVSNLLDLSRLETGGFLARIEWCDPVEMAAGAIDAARPVLDGHEVALLAPDGLPLVRADAVLCERVLVNLLHNAARHGAPPIALEVAIGDGALAIVVQDRGDGPDPALAGRLFTPFAAGRSSGGTGVGLALSHGLALAQGASLTFERDEATTRFVLALPLMPVPEVV